MPKPLLLHRPSGLYARYWVPLALREAVGSKTIVRSLGGLRGDAARLEAARLGYALAHRFALMKNQRPPRMPAPSSVQLGERIDVYLKTHAAARRPLQLFLALVGDKPIATVSAEDVDRYAEAMRHWPRDAGRRALFKDASPQEVLTRAKRAQAEPIAPETWRRSLAAVRVFMTGLIARGELDPAFIQVFDRWIGARAPMKPAMVPEGVLDASYSYTWRADGALDIRADTEADHQRVMALHDRVTRSMPRAPLATKGVRPLGEARDLFLVQFKEKNPAPATVHETVATLGLFVDIVGAGKPMDEVGVEDVDTLRAVLAVWPARARVLPAYRGLSTRDIIKKAKKEQPPGINVRTKDKHLDNVRKFFGWAVQRHEMTHNPLSGVRLQTKAQKATLTRRGFTQPELVALFEPHLRKAHACSPSYFWLPVLALHTGARLLELAQLRMVDVHEVGGVWGVDITHKSEI